MVTEVTDEAGMRGEAAVWRVVRLPKMEMNGRRFLIEAGGAIRIEIQDNRVGRTGCDRCGPVCKSGHDRSVYVSADDADDLGLIDENFGEFVGIAAVLAVHMLDSGLEWRVMHGNERGVFASRFQH